LLLGAAGTIVGGSLGMLVTEIVNALGGLTIPAQPQMSVATMNVLFTPQGDVLFQNGVALLLASIVAALLPGTMSFRRTVAELLKSH